MQYKGQLIHYLISRNVPGFIPSQTKDNFQLTISPVLMSGQEVGSIIYPDTSACVEDARDINKLEQVNTRLQCINCNNLGHPKKNPQRLVLLSVGKKHPHHTTLGLITLQIMALPVKTRTQIKKSIKRRPQNL